MNAGKQFLVLGTFFFVAGLTSSRADANEQALKFGGTLKFGRYIGDITLTESNEKIAVLADFFLESPDDFRLFPKLKVLFKLGFGGYNTHEYFTEPFEEIHYDFDNEVLTFDEPGSDLMIVATLNSDTGVSRITGDVFVRSSASSGSINLKFVTDEPEDEDELDAIGRQLTRGEAPFIPLLDGQYEGQCGSKKAAVQIQTIRGQNDDRTSEKEPAGLNRYYGISARLLYKDFATCSQSDDDSFWCVFRNYSDASYNPYLGKLTLHGRSSSDPCDLRQGQLNCQISIDEGTEHCRFTKINSNPPPRPQTFPRSFHLQPSPGQQVDLPTVSPPNNAALSSSLRGFFSGYLHHEATNVYQPIRLQVTPYSSTDNPHNPNQMMVTTTSLHYFSGEENSNFITQRFEPRSFYLRPGFILSGKDSDSFIQIDEWKEGSIRGVMFSKQFGRLGTIELLKGSLPEISPKAKLMPNFAGNFEGPHASGTGKTSLRLLFPSQPTDLKNSLVKFKGHFTTVLSTTAIVDGTYDPYTNRFGWRYTRDAVSTLVSGVIANDQEVKIYFPPDPRSFGSLTSDYVLSPYHKTE